MQLASLPAASGFGNFSGSFLTSSSSGCAIPTLSTAERVYMANNVGTYADFHLTNDELQLHFGAGSSSHFGGDEDGMMLDGDNSTGDRPIKRRRRMDEHVRQPQCAGGNGVGCGIINKVPSLSSLCIEVVCRNVDMLPELDGALPEEMLQRIASCLIAHGKMDDSVLERLLDPSITMLDVAWCKRFTNISCNLIAERCPRLTKLSLAYCTNITSDGIVAIANRCRELRFINLEGCAAVGDPAIEALATQCAGLVSVNLAGCVMITNSAIRLLRSCPSIQALSLKRCTQITDPVFEALGNSLQALDLSECSQLTDTAVMNIAQRSDNLQTLKLSGRNITDASLATVADQCTQLRHLELVGCERISDNAIRTLARMCTRLQSLNLSHCKGITAQAFQVDPELQFPIEFSSTTATGTRVSSNSMLVSTSSSGAVPIADHGHGHGHAHTHAVPQHGCSDGMHNLHRLDLTHCLSVSDEALGYIAYYCPNLLELTLAECETITDMGLARIAERCRSLQTIELSKCLKISDVGIEAIARNCRSLQRVGLRQCDVSDRGIIELTRHCRKMTELDLTSCERLTDQSVKLFAQAFPLLESLCIEELSDLTDVSLESLADGCRNLHTLKMAYCRLSDRVLHKLAVGCPAIRHLDISYCNNLSLRAIEHALSLWSNLASLTLRGYNALTTHFPPHPTLEVLKLSFCKGVEDGCIVAIAEGCPRLTLLDIAWCAKVTTNSIGRLVRDCPKLMSLNIRQCSQISPRIAGFISSRGITVYR